MLSTDAYGLNFSSVRSTEWFCFPTKNFGQTGLKEFQDAHGIKNINNCAIKYEIQQYNDRDEKKQFLEVSIRMITLANEVFGFVISNPERIITQISDPQDKKNLTYESIINLDLNEFVNRIEAASETCICLHFEDGYPKLRFILDK